MNTGIKNEKITHIRDYDFDVVCGGSESNFSAEYEIPRENTGTLKNQGTVDACLAEVIAQISESKFSAELGEKTEMSEGFIYGAYRSDDSNGYGLFLSQALKFWQTIGTLPKKYFDVLKEMPDIKDIVTKFPEFYDIAAKYKISGFVSLNYSDDAKRDNAVKTALTKYGYGLVGVSEKAFGSPHAVLITGWNDNRNCYKFKNSWGESYGDNGFSELSKSRFDKIYLPLFDEIKIPFTDVSESDWFYSDVKAAYFSGFMNGTSDTTFEPNKPLTRAEAAALINRISKETDKRFDILNRVLNENE